MYNLCITQAMYDTLEETRIEGRKCRYTSLTPYTPAGHKFSHEREQTVHNDTSNRRQEDIMNENRQNEQYKYTREERNEKVRAWPDGLIQW